VGDNDAVNLALLVLRLTLAIVMFAHGWAHLFSGGRIPGVASWFDSLGMRPGKLHAWLASLTEVGVAPLLALGLLTPVAMAATAGLLIVAWVTNHRDAGFFVYNRPTEGYEYVMSLVAMSFVGAVLGAGEWSLDRALDLDGDLSGWVGAVIFLVVGVGGAAGLLLVFWRPPDPDASGE
jgi:putative oxidoreductase